MTRPTFLTGMILALLLTTVALLTVNDKSVAQDSTATPRPTATPPFSVTLIAQAELTDVASSRLLLTASTVVVPLNFDLRPIVASRGPILIRVMSGRILLNADAAIVTAVAPIGDVIEAAQVAEPVEERVIISAEQVLLPTGATARISASSRPATLTVISLESQDSASADLPEAPSPEATSTP